MWYTKTHPAKNAQSESNYEEIMSKSNSNILQNPIRFKNVNVMKTGKKKAAELLQIKGK